MQPLHLNLKSNKYNCIYFPAANVYKNWLVLTELGQGMSFFLLKQLETIKLSKENASCQVEPDLLKVEALKIFGKYVHYLELNLLERSYFSDGRVEGDSRQQMDFPSQKSRHEENPIIYQKRTTQCFTTVPHTVVRFFV